MLAAGSSYSSLEAGDTMERQQRAPELAPMGDCMRHIALGGAPPHSQSSVQPRQMVAAAAAARSTPAILDLYAAAAVAVAVAAAAAAGWHNAERVLDRLGNAHKYTAAVADAETTSAGEVNMWQATEKRQGK